MDRPILFSGPMVRALLDGSKTQTRRILKPQPPAEATSAGVIASSTEGQTDEWTWLSGDPRDCETWGGLGDFETRFRLGDRLWVREAWRTTCNLDGLKPSFMDAGHRCKITFEADPENRNPLWAFGKLRPGMYLPRWASRLTLIVTDVRVQRLQQIDDEDARAEGALVVESSKRTSVARYKEIWNALNEARGFGWAKNPWVVAVTFTVHPTNIDEMAKARHG